eukprot:GFUD01031253.1.p1 GENE.GFUD01031253.1~~GFUD01031253.1.p1  ORF type:complete len:263 (+),score=65.07 GFUD01031253.1:206-994(+)
MAAFHKTKVYKSNYGCCICKAKSSSSRFTSSQKYEESFTNCFKLQEVRHGEVCNACVLIVKRWKKLPKNSHKNWAHVVDARNGPGVKNVLKQKPKEQRSETFGKIKRKHVYKKKGITHPRRITDKQRGQSLEIEDKLVVPDFIDLTYWTRRTICCGVIYTGQQGEAMVDQRYYKRCSPENHAWKQHNLTVSTEDILGQKMETEVDETNVSRSDETEFSEFFSDSESLTSKEDFLDLNLDTDGDEGFCDKINFRTSDETLIRF